jgi:hypothetical protein
MPENEGNIIDINDKLRERQLNEAVAKDDSKAFAPQNEQSPSIIKIIGRKINSVVRSVMSPKR